MCEPITTPIQFNKPCTPRNGLNFFEGYWGKFVGILILIVLFPAGKCECLLKKRISFEHNVNFRPNIVHTLITRWAIVRVKWVLDVGSILGKNS